MEEPTVECDADKNSAVIRNAIDRVRAATRDQIHRLEVDCDGEVLTIRGEVANRDLWRLAFHAAWLEARAAQGLLFDLQVQLLPQS